MESEAKVTMYDKFRRCTPQGIHKKIFDEAEVTKLKADKALRIVEVHCNLKNIYKKSDIYSLENEIAKEYGLSCVRIMTHYPPELFNIGYMDEIMREAARVGTVINGFFNDMTVELCEDNLKIKIPFGEGGIMLLDTAKTADVIQNIIYSEFSLKFEVTIEQTSDASLKYQRFEERQRDIINSQNAEIIARQQRYEEQENVEEAKEPEVELEHVASLFEGSDSVERKNESVIKSGRMQFDVSSFEVIFGGEIDIDNVVPIRAIQNTARNIVTVGEVFQINTKDTKKGDKTNITIGLTDKDSSIYVKTIAPIDKSGEILDMIKVGKSYLIQGNVKLDTFTNDLYIQYSDVLKVKRILREDTSPQKRVELHLHTCMSSMDAITKADEVVNTAHRWGHNAVAITDHGNLQSFPVAMLAAEKLGDDDFKVIYGLEGYFVDDTMRAAYRGDDITFDDEFVVFDIETTGLSPINCKITEIGAVITKNGEIIDKYNTFVNPGVPIPENIVNLTGITDEMVADARDISEVLPEFFAFCGDRMLVAHNASFDTSFIRNEADKCGIPFTNPYMDTVAMSHYINPNLKNHKLNTLAKHYNLGNFNHHRASDDAEMLAMIFAKMAARLKEEGIFEISRMNYVMSEKSDPLKLKTYHQIILVKNDVGLKNLYKLVSDSYLKYYKRFPRIPKTRLEELREGLIIGSACEAGELFRALLENRSEDELLEIASFYDYLEIQPISNNRFLVEQGRVADDEGLRELNRKIIEIGRKAGKPVVATCDAHYLDAEDEIYRRILLSGLKYSDADKETYLYYRTTDEMLAEFEYLGEELAREVVIENPQKIAAMIEHVRPIPKGNYPPHIDGAEEELTKSCYDLAHEMYGDPLPEEVSARLERELDSIIKNGFAIMYVIARKLVENSEAKGYQVGSRGSVGSSFAATMSGITKVNPLPPHYRCPVCKYSDFSNPTAVKSGFDLPEKECPHCHVSMVRDGHDIPFETFLGFYGDKTPDIDLNFSGDVQADAHKFTEVLFGEGRAFRAGTIGTLASKTAYGLTVKYLEDKGITVNHAEIDRLIAGCVGVKRTTGQHPGGIIVVPREYEVYDFCPVQHPADDPNSSIITTHFEFKYLHDTILKLDILGHDIPTKYKRLEEYSGINILDVPLTDPEVYKLFTSTEPLGVTPQQINSDTGTLGLPEMGTRFIRGVLMDAQPKCFADLLQISGLTHGTGVWLGNADELIKSGTCTIKDVIGCRDDIMLYLIHEHDLEKSLAFSIMEDVRKGRGLKPEYEKTMLEHGVPEWYIESCKKIKYMFPKAHAAAYVMDALRLAWFKIYHPVIFYAAYFTAAPSGFDAEIVMGGKDRVKAVINELSRPGADISQKEAETLDAMYLVNEFFQRGYSFLPVEFKSSDAHKFVPEDGKIRLPFDSLPGVGTNAADNIVTARETKEIFSVDDLKRESGMSKTVLEIFEKNNVLKGMSKTNQLSMF